MTERGIMFATAITILLCFVAYMIGLTVGYGGCVAQATDILTNQLLRGM